MYRLLALTLSALVSVVVAVPATARPAPTVRLVGCDAGDCLLVRGHRASRQAEVRINGRPVPAAGGTAWRVSLPVGTVRDWSAVNARTLRVAVLEPGAVADSGNVVRLPTGMLARKIELAFLTVRAP